MRAFRKFWPAHPTSKVSHQVPRSVQYSHFMRSAISAREMRIAEQSWAMRFTTCSQTSHLPL